MELTILIPCLNEAETIAVCVSKAAEFLRNNQIDGEVLVADNGSTDGSQQLAVDNGARVINVSQKGYGSALMAGSLDARGKYIIMGDADDSYDFSDLLNFVEKLREGYELVMGNRFAGGITNGAMRWKNRYIGNPVLSGLGKLFFGAPVGDFHCGLRGYSKEAFLELQLRTTGMEFASEMVIKACLKKMKIAEIAIKLYPDGRSRAPHLRPWRDGWRHLKFMLLLSPRWLLFYPSIFLISISLVLSIMLLNGPVNFMGVTFDIHTLMFTSCAVFMGFQMLSLSVLLKKYAVKTKVLTENNLSRFLFSIFSFEKGLIASALLFIMAIVLAVMSVLQWRSTGYGDISDLSHSLRSIIPSVFCFALSVQALITSCALATIDFLEQF